MTYSSNGCYRPEAAIALRQRLNETIEQLEELRQGHAELEVKYDTVNRELTIAKSDREECCFFPLIDRSKSP